MYVYKIGVWIIPSLQKLWILNASKYLHKGAVWGHSASAGCLKVEEYSIRKDIPENKIIGYE